MNVRGFNPEMLTLARETRGLTQADLADGVSLSQSELSKIETGMKGPSSNVVERLAGHLRYSVDFFFLPDQKRCFGSACIYHRKRKSATERDLRRLLAIVNVRRIQLRRLLIGAEITKPNEFHRLDIEDNHGSSEAIAQTIRQAWSIPPGPIQNLIREIESAGGIVIESDFGTNRIDALSQWVPDMPPLFFVNLAIPADRLRWTLAHEIGHIIMHQLPTEDMEKQADRFAAEFLMPGKEIKPHLGNVSLPKLAALKPYWKVAMSALLRRACDLGITTPRQRSYLWMQMGKNGYRTREPVDIPREVPTLLRELVDVHQNTLGYSATDIGNLVFSTDLSEVREVYLPNTQRLRIVSG